MIHLGDCRASMATMPARIVQTVVTSPPYFGLRDYDVDGQLGLEDVADCLGWATGNPCGQCFICVQVDVFRHVRRVLKDDGTCWINMGDSYAGSGRGGSAGDRSTLEGGGTHQDKARAASDSQRKHAKAAKGSRIPIGAKWKPKDLMMMPARLALALQADGWYLRQDVIWSKKNPMPESARDRCTKSHEYLFLLAKSERYYFDQDALREPASPSTHARMAQDVQGQPGSLRANGGDARPMRAGGRGNKPAGWASGDQDRRDLKGRYGPSNGVGWGYGEGEAKPRTRRDPTRQAEPDTRNKRSVWTIGTQAFKEAHFATFPEALVEPCILAGSRAGDLVLDPFLGSGTTAVVAQRLGRRWVACELNPGYIAMAQRRIDGTPAGLVLA